MPDAVEKKYDIRQQKSYVAYNVGGCDLGASCVSPHLDPCAQILLSPDTSLGFYGKEEQTGALRTDTSRVQRQTRRSGRRKGTEHTDTGSR